MDNESHKLWESYNENKNSFIELIDSKLLNVLQKIKGTNIDNDQYYDQVVNVLIRHNSYLKPHKDYMVDRIKELRNSDKLEEFLAPLGAAGTTANGGPILTSRYKKKRN